MSPRQPLLTQPQPTPSGVTQTPEQPSLRGQQPQFGLQPPSAEDLYWFNSGLLAAAAAAKTSGDHQPQQSAQPQPPPQQPEEPKVPTTTTAPDTSARQAQPVSPKSKLTPQQQQDADMGDDLYGSNEPPYFGPRGPTAAENEAMDDGGAQAGDFNADETFTTGDGDSSGFQHRPFLPLLDQLPTPKVPTTEAGLIETSGTEQTSAPPLNEPKKSKASTSAHQKSSKRARLQKHSPERDKSKSASKKTSAAVKTPVTSAPSATSVASSKPKTPSSTASQSRLGTQRREAAARAEERIQAGTTTKLQST